MNAPTPPRMSLLERLDQGPVICAEGYVFELERRGYLQAGAFVPEVVLEHPEVVTQLHRDFVHAGSDVVEALTYYAHREKLRVIGREQDLEPINRRALDIAKAVAMETGALFAGDICNTNVFDPADPASHKAVRAMFEEQVGWAVDAGVDYIVGETFSWAQEALIALDVIKQAKQTAVITLAMHKADVTREDWTVADACQRLADAGADVVGLNCIRGPATMLPLLREIRARVKTQLAALPVPYRTSEKRAVVPVAARHALALRRRQPAVSRGARSVHLQPLRDRRIRARRDRARHPLSRRVLRRGSPSHPRARRSGRQDAAREQVFGGHVEARVPGLARADQAGAEGLREQALTHGAARRGRGLSARHAPQPLGHCRLRWCQHPLRISCRI